MTDYENLVLQAEQAVASVKDPELKRIAFEKILDSLLRGGKQAAQPAPASSEKKHRRKGSSPTGTSETQARKRRAGVRAYVDELVDEGFFAQPQTIAAVKAKLANRGHHIPITGLSGPLQTLCQRRRLRREKAQAPDGNRKSFAYTNW